MRQPLHRRPSPSLMVAIAAVVIASTGSAVAATVITSRQIKNGTIQLVDLNKTARDTLQGGRGPQGPVGANGAMGAKGDTGATGPAGAPGSAIAYARIKPNGDVVDAKNIELTGRGPSGGVKIYCLNNTAGGVVNAQVTADAAMSDPLFVKFGADRDPASIASRGCPATTDLVVTADTTNANTRGIDAGFFVAIIA